MALTQLEKDTISKALSAAKKTLEELKPVIDALNILYDSEGGLKNTIDQAGMDEIPALSGLTKGQLDDGMFVLTATMRTGIANGYFALVQLAARG